MRLYVLVLLLVVGVPSLYHELETRRAEALFIVSECGTRQGFFRARSGPLARPRSGGVKLNVARSDCPVRSAHSTTVRRSQTKRSGGSDWSARSTTVRRSQTKRGGERLCQIWRRLISKVTHGSTSTCCQLSSVNGDLLPAATPVTISRLYVAEFAIHSISAWCCAL